jgi:NAD-dependent deacetylase
MLDGDPRYTCDYATNHTEAVKIGNLCPKCNSQLRPDVVWFDEPVAFEFETMRELVREVKYNNGVFICIGTSAQVHPAAALIPLFVQVANKYIIDLNARPIGNYTLLKGSASEKMKELADKLLEA